MSVLSPTMLPLVSGAVSATSAIAVVRPAAGPATSAVIGPVTPFAGPIRAERPANAGPKEPARAASSVVFCLQIARFPHL